MKHLEGLETYPDAIETLDAEETELAGPGLREEYEGFLIAYTQFRLIP